MELAAGPSHYHQQQQQQQASYRQPVGQVTHDPYLTPPQYREAGPSIDSLGEGQMLSYPPLKNAERRRSGSNGEFGTRRALAANLQMVEPYSNGVNRPTYTQR